MCICTVTKKKRSQDATYICRAVAQRKQTRGRGQGRGRGPKHFAFGVRLNLNEDKRLEHDLN